MQCRLRGAIRSRHSGTVGLCVSLLNCSIPVPSYSSTQGTMGSRGVRLMPASAALSCLGPGSVWRSGLAWCILALYIVVLFIPYSLVGAARQGLAAGCFHPQSLLCLWLQPTLSRPLRALLTLSKTKAIRTRTHSGAAGRASVLCPRPPLLPPQAQMGPGRLVAWARGPASVGPGLPLIWQR